MSTAVPFDYDMSDTNAAVFDESRRPLIPLDPGDAVISSRTWRTGRDPIPRRLVALWFIGAPAITRVARRSIQLPGEVRITSTPVRGSQSLRWFRLPHPGWRAARRGGRCQEGLESLSAIVPLRDRVRVAGRPRKWGQTVRTLFRKRYSPDVPSERGRSRSSFGSRARWKAVVLCGTMVRSWSTNECSPGSCGEPVPTRTRPRITDAAGPVVARIAGPRLTPRTGAPFGITAA